MRWLDRLRGSKPPTITERINQVRQDYLRGLMRQRNDPEREPEVLCDQDGKPLPFQMGLLCVSFPIRLANGTIRHLVTRGQNQRVDVEPGLHRLPSGGVIIAGPFQWAEAVIRTTIPASHAQRIVSVWFQNHFRADDLINSPFWVLKPISFDRHTTMILVDFGGVDAAAVCSLLIDLAQTEGAEAVLMDDLSAEMHTALYRSKSNADARYREKWDPTWCVPYPRDVVERAVAAVADGRSLINIHRDYCGVGIALEADMFKIGYCEDGFVDTVAMQFDDAPALVDWLCQQSNSTMNGHDPEGPLFQHRRFYVGNQRITLQRLLDHGKGRNDHFEGD